MAYATYRLDPNNPPTFDGTTIESVKDFSINTENTSTDGKSDGNRVIQAIMVDSVAANVIIATSNPKQFIFNSKFEDGACGVLVLHCISHGCGSSPGIDTVTITCAKAVVINTSNMVPYEGEGAGTITFRLADNGSDALWVTS